MEKISKKEALAQGLKHYFSGKPCCNGHVDVRFTSNSRCKSCAREDSLRYLDKNRDNHYKKAREWRHANKMYVKEYRRQYAAKNYEENLERWANYRLKNRHALRERNASRYRENLKKYRAMGAESTSRGKAKLLNLAPNWPCCDCLVPLFYTAAQEATEKTGVKHTVDHIIPYRGRTVSGLHVASNLQVLTLSENSAKNNKYEQAREYCATHRSHGETYWREINDEP